MTALFGGDSVGSLFGDPGSTFGDLTTGGGGGGATFPQVRVRLALDNPPLSPVGLWTDITDVTLAFTTNRGKSGTELDPVQIGTCTLTVNNSDGRFDVDNTTSPYYGKLHAGVRVHIDAAWAAVTYDIFDGYLDVWGPLDGTLGLYHELNIPASDAFKFFSNTPVEAMRPFTIGDPVLGHLDDPLIRIGGGLDSPVQRSGDRIASVLDVLAWPFELRDLDRGLSAVVADSVNTAALEYLQKVEKSEYGKLYVTAGGLVRFDQRRAWTRTPTQATSQARFSDNPADGEGEYSAFQFEPTSISRMRNIVKRGRTDGPQWQVRDVASIQQYGPSPDEATDLLTSKSQELLDQARYVLTRFKDPVPRVTQITVDGSAQPDVHFPQILGREYADRLTIGRTPPAGATVDREMTIDQISHTVDARDGGTWTTTWGLALAEQNIFFKIEDPILGQLDSVSVLAY